MRNLTSYHAFKIYNYINLNQINILKHKTTKTKADRKIKEQKRREMKKENFETNTSKKSSSSLILTVPLSQIYSQFNKRMISNLKLKDQGQKMP